MQSLMRKLGGKKENAPKEGQPIEPEEALFSTAGDYGFKTLAEGKQDKVDIVFVHGLTGNRESTWTYSKTLFWPRDLLAKELPNTRILTFGYDADVIGIINVAGSNTIRDHGKSLAQDLAMLRMRSKSNDRPMIFVAHSLGGLVVEQALLISRGSSQAHVKALLHNVSAIAFMGTPHLGSRQADWAGPITHLSNMLRKTNKEIVAVLKPGSEMLANLQQEFHTMLEDRRRNEGKWIDVFCFYEELPYPGIGDIVPRRSAILADYPNASIHSNHSDMTKFTSDTDSGYIRVRDQLWLWVEGLNANEQSEGPVSEQLQLRIQEAPHQSSNSENGRASDNGEVHDSGRSIEDRPQGERSIASGGGAIFMGNVKAGRDFTYNHN